jgi:hypothetical protein
MTGRHAYRSAEISLEEDPFERTRPDAAQEATQEAVEGAAGEERARSLRPRDRRFLETVALLTLLPVLLVLYWITDVDLAGKLADKPEKQTLVPRATVATWQNVKWRLYGQAVGGPPPGQGPEVAELRLAVAVRPLNAEGVKVLTAIKYQVVDSEGHAWTALGVPATLPRAGIATKVTVRAVLPRSKTDSVLLEVRPPAYLHPNAPLPSLRFAR